MTEKTLKFRNIGEVERYEALHGPLDRKRLEKIGPMTTRETLRQAVGTDFHFPPATIDTERESE